MKTTLQEYIGAWLAQRELSGTMRPSSVKQYARTFRLHVVPYIGVLPIGGITVPVARKLLDTLVDRSLLEMPTVRGVRARLKRVLDDAVRDGLLKVNPFLTVTVGKGHLEPVRAMSEGQLKQLLDYARPHRFGPVVRLALSTGLGRRELAYLRWRHVDLEAKHLLLFKRGHTRRLPLTDDMAAELGRMRIRAVRDAALGGHDVEEQCVLLTRFGRPWELSTLSNAIRIMFKEAGLEGFHLQDLRSSHVAMLLRSRRSMQQVADLLGLASHRSARNVYGRVVAGED